MPALDDILSKVEAKANLNKEELRAKVEKKQADLSGLVSLEGAAYLVAKDLGVNLLNNEKRRIELRNIFPGMRNVSAAGRVFRISKIVSFKKSNGSDGRVANLFIGDSTSFVRLPLWNDQVEIVENELVKLGDVVQVVGGLSDENIYGDVEIALGKYGRVFSIDEEAASAGVEFPSVDELSKAFLGPRTGRVPIRNLSSGSFEIRAMVIDMVRGKFLFNTCPNCGGTVKETSIGILECEEHGKVEAVPVMVISFIADDGTGALRVVAFRDVAEKLATTTASELSKLSVEERYKLLSGTVVGKEFIFHGRVKKNKSPFGPDGIERLEMIADDVQDLNISKESEELAELLKMKLG